MSTTTRPTPPPASTPPTSGDNMKSLATVLAALALLVALAALWKGCDAPSSSEIAALTGRVTTVETDVNGTIAPAVVQLQSDVATLATEVGGVRSDVTDLAGRVTRNEADIRRIRRGLHGLRQEVVERERSTPEVVTPTPPPATDGPRLRVTRTIRVGAPGS